MADYALETAGARVVDTGETLEHIVYESPVSWVLHMISSILCRECPGASTIIRPGNLPGECWAFRGSRGEATIREISSAPRLFQLEGLEFRGDPYPHDFGTFEYDKNGKPIQYYEVLQSSSKGFNLVRLKVYSNWGHTVYTCVYRVRVHGELISDQARSTAQVNDDDLRIENE
ncbi:jg8201 [Pararge aegeria aegeria]|uniref:Jg8201 protein n=1 Tax=Pararge aegeria aegeria TaxID=348720 RepID=A0A8S4SQ38_9NEOP|nr:jg8201 [Pararge aegeria aegeria]